MCFLVPAVALAQPNYYGTNGTEYAIVGSLLGDQTFPDAALNSSGGFVVWQDNATDGSGLGISATRLDSTLSATTWSDERVNVQGTNDQQNARVALLKNGGAVFVWQGGAASQQHIYARFLNASNTWVNTNDVLVNVLATNSFYSYVTNTITTITTHYNPFTHQTTYTTNTTTTVTTITNVSTAGFQIAPAVAVLNDGNVIVVWSSFDQVNSNSLQDVYGQFLSPDGTKIGGEFLINQFTPYNQRNPTVAALANGGFVTAWVSEQERSTAPNWGDNTNYYGAGSVPLPSVDIYARLYDSNGVAQTGEFLVNADSNPAADPEAAAASDGSYMITWDAKDMAVPENSWDVYARSFTNAAGGAVVRVNSYTYGDQYAPRISAIGGDYLIVFTSLGQDGSREGVFGQFVHEDSSLTGSEFRVNTTTLGQQMQPAVTSDGSSQFLVVWTSFTFGPSGFDLFAQRYLNVSAVLEPMEAPFVFAPFTLSNGVYQPQLVVSWPPVQGISISNYEIYADGAASPMAATASNVWTMTAANGLTTNSTHSFRVDYVTTDGRKSPISPSASGTTWSGLNWGGIPYEWMAMYFGGYSNGKYYTNFWPAATAPLASGGPALLQVFQSGGNPLDPGTWLHSALTKTPEGMFLSWNTQPGFTYQVQVTTNFISWNNLGAPRFAAGTSDSIYVGGTPAGYYRVMLLRQ